MSTPVEGEQTGDDMGTAGGRGGAWKLSARLWNSHNQECVPMSICECMCECVGCGELKSHGCRFMHAPSVVLLEKK